MASDGVRTRSPSRVSGGDEIYSEADVARILQRTAQLERGQAQPHTGLTLGEVEAIARESGLDPGLVRVAAASLHQTMQEQGLGAKIAGAPLRRTFERVIEGELEIRHHEALVGELRAAVASLSSQPIQVSSVGRTLSLSTRGATSNVELSLSPRAGRTILRIEVSKTSLAGALFGGLFGGLGGGALPVVIGLSAANDLSALGLAAICMASLTGTFALARTLFASNARKTFENAEALADSLADKARSELSQQS